MSEENKVTVDATPWLILMTIVLMCGKLMGWWNMSWMWVFSPLWIPFAFVLGIIAILAVVAIVVFLVALIASVMDK